MVKNTEWSDKQLEDLLRDMPKVKDNRDPRDIYQQILLKQKKQKRQRTWIMPSFAAAAALLLLFVLSPTLMPNNETSQEFADKASMSGAEESTDNARLEIVEDENSNSSMAEKGEGTQDNNNMGIMAAFNTSAVYEQDLEAYDVITYGIPDANIQNVVPITLLVEKNPEKTWLEQYVNHMDNIEEEQWGLSEYFPMEANFSLGENDETIIVDIPYAKPYDYSSTTEKLFFQVLQESFENKGITKILFLTEGSNGISFSHYGQVYEKDLTKEKGNKAYLLLNEQQTNQSYLVPTPSRYETVNEAIDAMKTEIVEYQLKPVIPNNIYIERIEEQGTNLLLTFSPDSVIQATEESIKMIEALLLTAMEFGYETVQFENTNINQLGPFNFIDPVQVPIAANKQIIVR